MTYINLLVYILMTMLGALGSISFSLIHKKPAILQKIRVFILGASFYFLSALLNIYLLKFIPISILMPLASLNYLWVYLLANLLYKEPIRDKLLGLVCILVGLILLSL